MDPSLHDGPGCEGIGAEAWNDTGAHAKRYSVSLSLSSAERGEDERSSLIRTIESEVIPRLMLLQASHRGRPPPEPRSVTGAGGRDSFPSVEDFAEVAMTGDEALAVAYVEAMRGNGASLETVCHELLGPAARRMGDWWHSDQCSFAEVTLGLCRLQQLLRDYCDRLPGEASAGDFRGLRAFLVPVPGEQHTFGLSMVMEFFRRAGWDVDGGPGIDLEELKERVHTDWFHVVGFSASSAAAFPTLTNCIRAVRKVSRNPALGVLVGGLVFAEHPEMAMQVGADATCESGQQAPLQAERLLAVMARAAR